MRQVFFIIGFILLLMVVGSVAFTFFVKRSLTPDDLPALASGALLSEADTIVKASSPPEGYVKYENKQYGFSFYHAQEAEVSEYDEGGGAMTVVLENKSTVRGMQIFIVPYNEPLISEERFKMDVPSGVRKNVEDTILDGVRAVTFNSYDERLGETREIWVIHNGYLFEITTMSGTGNWFIPVIQSWRFL